MLGILSAAMYEPDDKIILILFPFSLGSQLETCWDRLYSSYLGTGAREEGMSLQKPDPVGKKRGL